MLKYEDLIREFPVKLGVDRDCEIPLLMEFLHSKAPIESLLDIGAHSSAIEEKYGHDIRKIAKRYDGIDIMPDSKTAELLDNYIVANVIDYPFGQMVPAGYPYKGLEEGRGMVKGRGLERYDTVICVSTIEHAGLSTYKKEDPYEEREKLFMRCLELTKKYLWISFPVGQEYTYPGELSIISDKQLKHWESMVSNFKVKQRFTYNQGPQAKHPWYEHTKRDVAIKIPYIDYIGNQSICVLEVEK